MDNSPFTSLTTSSASLASNHQRPSGSLLATPELEKIWSSELALVTRQITMEQFVDAIDQQQLDIDPDLELDLQPEEEEEEDVEMRVAKVGVSEKRNLEELGIWSRIEMATGRAVPRKRRFVIICRFVLYVLWWRKFANLAMEERRRETRGGEPDDTEGLIEVEESDGAGQKIFDTSFYQTKWATTKDLLRGLLDKTILKVLRKQEWQRTTEELQKVEKFVVRYLRFFSGYSERVRVEVGRVMSLEVVTRGRVIVRQGDPASGFYFLVRGTAIVLLSVPDQGRQRNRIMGELDAGSCFGSTALLNNIKRGTTIISKGTSDLLRVDKDDFRSILESTSDEELQTRLMFLSELPQFAGVEPETLRNCSQHSVLLTYAMDKIVSAASKKDDGMIRFIVTGSCDVIRNNRCRPESSLDQSKRSRIPMICAEPWELGGRQKRRPFTGGNFRSKVKVKDQTEVVHVAPVGRHMGFLHVGVLDKGAYFGVGEDLSGYIIVSKTRLQLLMLRRSIFAEHLGSARLRRLRQELEQAIPGEPEVCRLYANDIRWAKYKQEVLEESLEEVNRVREALRLRTSTDGARSRSKVKAIPRLRIG